MFNGKIIVPPCGLLTPSSKNVNTKQFQQSQINETIMKNKQGGMAAMLAAYKVVPQENNVALSKHS